MGPIAVLAQLVERKALNLVVQGSSPWGGVSLFAAPLWITPQRCVISLLV